MTQIYTDGSKDPETNKTGIAVFVPQHEIVITKRTPDILSVLTAEPVDVVMTLQWVEEKQIKKAVICSDSLAELKSIQYGQSKCRQDLILQIMQTICRFKDQGTAVSFICIPLSASQLMLE